MNLELIAKNAKEASYKLASLSEEIKNKALADKIAGIKPDALKDISAARAENGDYILIYKNIIKENLK